MHAHHADFQDRIARIKAGKGFTKATVYVGMDQSFTFTPANRRGGRGMGGTLANAGHALSYPVCLGVGFVCHGLERLAAFLLTGLPDRNANVDMEMVRMAVAGFALTIVATHLLGFRDRGLMLAKLLGVAAGMLFFHNFVHAWPWLFERIFSPLWVAHITSATEAHSLLWRGISFPF